jgi:hypothetical protein
MSLVRFQSPTQGSVIMFGRDAQQLLAALNLPESGEISSAQMPSLVTQLEGIIAIDKVANPIVWPEDLDAESDMNAPIEIQLAQRAAPVLQLLKRSLNANETITW